MKAFSSESGTILLAVCAVLACAFLFCFCHKRHSGKGGKKNDSTTPSPLQKKRGLNSNPEGDRSSSDLAAFRIVFANRIEAFRKDMLAYHLERLAGKNHLSFDMIEKIRADYGKVLLQPSLYIYQELTQHHLEENDLVALEQEWLQERGYPVPADNLKDEIEKVIFTEEHKKAVQIAMRIMPDKNDFKDYL